jgi:hypothetical protein
MKPLTLMSRTRSAMLLVPSLVALAVLPNCSSSEPPPEGASGTAGNAGHSPGGGSGGTGGASGAGAGTSGASGTSGGTSGSAGSGGNVAGGAGGTSSGGSAGTPIAGAGGSSGATGGAASGGTAGGGDAGMTSGGSSGSAGSNAGSANGGASAGTSGAGAGGTGATEPTFHVFLLLGQSNMAGYAKAEAADKVEDERVRVLGFDDCAETGRQADEWDTAAPPLHECWNGAVGPGDHFAKTLLPTLPPDDTIGLVPCAVSGERIETFLKVGGTRYDWILDRAKLAQDAGGVIEGILFHQGESNNGDSSWPGKVNSLVTDLRTDLGIGDVPFLAGELVGGGASHNAQVARLPDMISNAHVISAAGLVVDPADTQWNLHFDHDSTVTLGIRYAEKMIDVLGL